MSNVEINLRFWPFKKTELLPPAEQDWLLTKFKWLIEEYGSETDWPNRTIVLPDSKSFKTAGKSGHDLAEYVFAQVQEKSGTNHIKVRLAADQQLPDYEGDNLMRPVHPDLPAGTYQRNKKGERIITYNPAQLKNPVQLVSTLAHENAHALLDSKNVSLPVESDLELELLTDLAAVFLGFGIFLSNSAFEYQQFQDGSVSGWSYQRLGYLPQNQLIFATAAFVAIKRETDDGPLKYLRPGLDITYSKAKAQISRLETT